MEGRKLCYPSRALAGSFPGPRFPHLTNEPDNPVFSTSPVAGEPNSTQVRNDKGAGAGTGEGVKVHRCTAARGPLPFSSCEEPTQARFLGSSQSDLPGSSQYSLPVSEYGCVYPLLSWTSNSCREFFPFLSLQSPAQLSIWLTQQASVFSFL